MAEQRPKVSVPLTPLDMAIEMIAITILLLMWAHVIMEYNSLPEIVASHFNAKGEADGYSNKRFIWFLPALACVIYIGLFILNRYPHLHNYMVNITKENALKHYKFSTRLLRIVNVLCCILFAYINYQIIEGAKKEHSELGIGFLVVIISFSLLLPVAVLVYQNRLNK